MSIAREESLHLVTAIGVFGCFWYLAVDLFFGLVAALMAFFFVTPTGAANDTNVVVARLMAG